MMEWDKVTKGEKVPGEVLYLAVINPTPEQCRDLLKLCVEMSQKETPDGRMVVCCGINKEDLKEFVVLCQTIKANLKTPPKGMPGTEFVKF